jgi:hypothetical protein
MGATIMKRTGRTSIDKLTVLGHELTEGHLALATGSRRPDTYVRSNEKPGSPMDADYNA